MVQWRRDGVSEEMEKIECGFVSVLEEMVCLYIYVFFVVSIICVLWVILSAVSSIQFSTILIGYLGLKK